MKINKPEIETTLVEQTIRETVLSVYGVASIDDPDTEKKKGRADSGIEIHRCADRTLELSVYLVFAPEVKITEVLRECQNQLRYVLDKKFPNLFRSISVYVNEVLENK